MNPKTMLEGIAGGLLVTVVGFVGATWTENQRLKREINEMRDRLAIYKTLTVLGLVGTCVGVYL